MAGGEAFANNASTALAVAVATAPAAGTSETWTVNSTASFPQIGTAGVQQFRVTCGPSSDTSPEIGVCTAINSSTTMTVTRGAEGSTVKTHAAGDPITHTFTAAAVSAMVPTGKIDMFGGFSAPPGWLLCDGTAYSRATYPALWATVSMQQTGTSSSGSNAVTGLADTSQMGVGMPITGPGLAATGVVVAGITSGTAITVSANASTGFGTGTFTVAPFGVGDGSTTFNVPDLRGRSPMGVGQAGGLTARVLGLTAGAETVTHNHGVSATHSHASAAHTHTMGNHVHADAAHTHTMGNHVHADAAHTHTLSDSAWAAIGWGAAGSITMRRLTSANWTATVASTSSTAVPLSGNTSSNTLGIGLLGSTDSDAPGNSGGPSTNTSDSTSPGNSGVPSTNTSDSTTPGSTSAVSPGVTDISTPSTVSPVMGVNFMIKT